MGLGYVGLPLAVELAGAGYRVLGFDISERVVSGLNAGRSHVKDISDEQLNAVMGSHLEAAREFRKTSDDTPNDPLAADALLRVGDVYADLWRRPELDPSYGQTALATYQELVNRYPGTNAATRAQGRIADLQERFAYKEYRAALYYFKLKAYDSAILYLKDVAATYPRAAITPEALVKLVQAYQKLGYKEDVEETCGYIRRFHPDAAKRYRVCLTDSTGAS